MPERPWNCPNGIQEIDFNTGYTYSMNMQYEELISLHHFGGEEDGLFEVYGHKWGPDDREKILQLLDDFSLPRFEQFELSVEGTENLCSFLKNERPLTKQYMHYVLGCVIYHQLLYTDSLRAVYLEAE